MVQRRLAFGILLVEQQLPPTRNGLEEERHQRLMSSAAGPCERAPTLPIALERVDVLLHEHEHDCRMALLAAEQQRTAPRAVRAR